jgi:hypothetical protein
VPDRADAGKLLLEEALLALTASCRGCGAMSGDPHWPDCPLEAFDLDQAIRTCRERGWSVAYVPGEGLRPCHPDEPGAYVDLDRYVFLYARPEHEF